MLGENRQGYAGIGTVWAQITDGAVALPVLARLAAEHLLGGKQYPVCRYESATGSVIINASKLFAFADEHDRRGSAF